MLVVRGPSQESREAWVRTGPWVERRGLVRTISKVESGLQDGGGSGGWHCGFGIWVMVDLYLQRQMRGAGGCQLGQRQGAVTWTTPTLSSCRASRASEGSCRGVKDAQEAGLHWELGSVGRTLTGVWGSMSQMVLR